MLQTRRQAVRLLQRPYSYQLRGYTDIRPPDPTNPSRGNTDKTISGNESNGKPSEHAASAGHHEPTHQTSYPTPENEPIGKGLYISLAVLFGSFAVYKFSRSDSSDPASAGDISKQPLITRLLHSFGHFGEQDATRNARFTGMVEQAGHDRNLFEGSPGSQHVELKAPEVFFNSGSPWNVSAGQTANLEHVREHYWKQNVKMEEERKERLEWMAQNATAKKENEKVKEVFGQTINAVSSVGKKAAKGD